MQAASSHSSSSIDLLESILAVKINWSSGPPSSLYSLMWISGFEVNNL